MMTNAQSVLDFWFGAPGSEGDGQVRVQWFQKNAAFDAEIASCFGALMEQALVDGLADWQSTPETSLAAILVLDQFTRNSFRGEAKSFAGDPFALQIALRLLDEGAALSSLHQWFALMPLEHAEDLAIQQRCVREFEPLAARDERLSGALDYARKHRDVIARFGRFPHRNAILGRESTAEELAYLAQPGSGF
jgi:uncharacterized protein (DUF924 family)